jgi:uncharacterized protein (TIGR03083 family)
MSQEKFYLPDLDPFLTLDQEVARIQSLLDSLRPEEWTNPTRCEEWTIRDLVAHLDSVEEYNEACLEDRVKEFISGFQDLDAFNTQEIKKRAHLSNEEIVEQWVSRQTRVREKWAELGLSATIPTFIGPMPLRAQIWGINSEYATHGDDMGVFVGEEEGEFRLMWRVQFSLFALQQKENPPGLERTDDAIIVTVNDSQMAFSDEDFVSAVSARLPLPEDPKDRMNVESLRTLV